MSARPSLARLVRYWAPRMRVQDWTIEIGYAPCHEMRGPIGHNRYDVQRKEASISILEPRDRNPADQGIDQIERTVVHELAHLHFAAFDTANGSPAGIAEEQAVNAFSNALVDMRRSLEAVPTKRKR